MRHEKLFLVSSAVLISMAISTGNTFARCLGQVVGYASSNVSEQDGIYLAQRDWVRNVFSRLGSPWHRYSNAVVIEEDCPDNYSGYSYGPSPNDRYYCRVVARPCAGR